MSETREVYEQRRRAVAEAILGDPEHFNMGGFIRGTGADPDPMCGTTLCIAGWAVLQMPGVKMVRGVGTDVDLFTADGHYIAEIEGMAGGWLGLDLGQADILFYGRFNEAVRNYIDDDGASESAALETITPDEAIAALMAAPYVCDAPASAEGASDAA